MHSQHQGNSEPSWMGGPTLPPLSESILMSGLISEKNVINGSIKKKMNQANQSNLNINTGTNVVAVKSTFKPTNIPSTHYQKQIQKVQDLARVSFKSAPPEKLNLKIEHKDQQQNINSQNDETYKVADNQKNLHRSLIVPRSQSSAQRKGQISSLLKSTSAISRNIGFRSLHNDTPTVPLCYKPTPIEDQSKKQTFIFPFSNLSYAFNNERNLQSRSSKTSSIVGTLNKRESIQNRDFYIELSEISAQLDTVIEEDAECQQLLMSMNNNDVIDDQQKNGYLAQSGESKLKVIQSFNYAFNKIILQERNENAERALLLHRIQKFYVETVKDFPVLYSQYDQKLTELTEKHLNLIVEYESISKRYENLNKDVLERDGIINNLNCKIESLTEESNQKDITIQSNSFDLDFVKGQLTQTQFKLQQKKEKNNHMKIAIKERDEEAKKQMEQLDAASKTIDDYKRQDIGYLPAFLQAKTDLEKAEKEITELKNEIEKMKTIPKDDKNVDTSDLPKSPKKRLKLATNGRTSSKASFTDVINDSNSRFKTTTNNVNKDGKNLSKPKLGSRSGKRSSKTLVGNGSSGINSSDSEKSLSAQSSFSQIPNLTGQNSLDLMIRPLCIHIGVQTDLNNQNNGEENIHPPSNALDLQQSRDSELQLTTTNITNKQNVNINGKENQINDSSEEFDVPDLLPYITPILAQTYRAPTVHPELQIFAIYNYDKVVKNQKPLMWGVQIIHNFLVDPFLRSVTELGNQFESILNDWLTKQYKLLHIVRQVSADLSLFLYHYVEQDKYVKFFHELLTGQFSISEILFISTIYTFSVKATVPSLTKMIEKNEVHECFDFVTIPEDFVRLVFSRSFTDEIADSFVKLIPRATNQDENEGNKDFSHVNENDGTMKNINFIVFLKEAGKFFGEKHRQLLNQSRNLLTLCGSSDYNQVYLQPFSSFCTLLKVQGNYRKEYQLLKDKSALQKSNDFIQFADLITFCANKRKPMIDLLLLFNLTSSISSLKSNQDLMIELYHDFRMRVCDRLSVVLEKLPDKLRESVNPVTENLRFAILRADIHGILWYYRVLITKIDRNLMKEKGSIPFPQNATLNMVRQLVEYFDRTESVAFAFLE